MKLIYTVSLSNEEEKIVAEISFRCGILKETARLLYYRGITDVCAAKRFLQPSKKHFNDPFALKGMREAVNRIRLAKEKGETVLVFGDYDADGICATAILCGCLEKFGITPLKTVPEREEGYGLNVAKIEKINSDNKIDLIITVDCGISDAEKINDLKSRGIDVIVTDHHEPPEILPDCICINPKIKGQDYGFDGLCGGGVAYKLGYALLGDIADEYLDFVAVATVADSMDLVKENRDLVAEGLKIINKHPRPAFRSFLGDGDKETNAQTLAYSIAPRVNAGGRMGDAFAALKLFSSTDEKEIFDLTVKLNVYNATRQSLCEEAFSRAKKIVSETGANADRVIVVRGEKWNAGILGIVAAKLVETYNKPVIVFAKHGDAYKGSARSVDGINIYETIAAVKEYLSSFGGHAQAAGLSVTEENFLPFVKALNEYAERTFGEEEKEKEIYVDLKAEEEISVRFAEEIERLEPFGVGNRRPLFAAETFGTEMKPLKEDSPHYSFSTAAVEILDFNGAKDVETMACPVGKTVVFELNLSTFRNKRSIKGFLRNIVCDYGDFSAFYGGVFSRELKRKGDSPVNLKRTDEKIISGYGTAYVLCDADSVKAVKNSGLKIYPYEIPEETGKNCIVLSPDFIPYIYKRVVYLDEPLTVNGFNGRAVLSENPLNKVAAGLVADRGVFEKAFAKISEGVGRAAKDFIAEKTEGADKAERKQFLFCYEVFKELGFFREIKGIITRERTVRKQLTDSALFRIVGEKRC